MRLGQFGMGEEAARGVFCADDGLAAIELVNGPTNCELWIVPNDRALTSRVVEIGCLVEDLRCVREDEKSVGKSFGNPEELEVAVVGKRCEMKAGPAAEVRRAGAEVEGNVPDVARQNADELALGFPELVVQAAEDTLAGERLIVLDELAGETPGREGGGVEHFGKPAPVILEAARLQQFDSRERGFKDLHSGILVSADRVFTNG